MLAYADFQRYEPHHGKKPKFKRLMTELFVEESLVRHGTGSREKATQLSSELEKISFEVITQRPQPKRRK